MTSRNILVDLAYEYREISESQEHKNRRKNWANLIAIKPTRPLVNMFLYPYVWLREIGIDSIFYTEGLERILEEQMRFRIWKANTFKDDEPVPLKFYLPCSRPQREKNWLWDVNMAVETTQKEGSSYKEIPSIKSEKDIEKIKAPKYQEDISQTEQLQEKARSLIEDLIPIEIHSNELHWGPFEYAVKLRGMEQLAFDLYDRPEFVHKLMEKITEGMISYQLEREKQGRVRVGASFFGHVPHDNILPGTENKLSGCWAYIHAQSSGMFSPEMYAEFVHPYNCKIASLTGKNYYHGCEDLSKKCKVIKNLPGLRLFHISPWTPAEPVIEALGDTFVYEIHSHPTKVLFHYSKDKMKQELCKLNDIAIDVAHTLTIADIETFGDNIESLQYWAETAKEIVES